MNNALEPKQPEFRGDCKALLAAKEPEVILAGPRDTGKTVSACEKVHRFCHRCPGAQGNIMRKTNKSLAGTVLKTFERTIAGFKVKKYGGQSPTKYVYPNGSVVWVGGMDNADKVLSSERDFIYVNQAEEFTLADWEACAGSCSGRGSVVKFPQLFGDCNPGGSKHWIRERSKQGKLRLLSAKHRDNPDLYDNLGNITSEGTKRLLVLENLTGIRRKRFYEGLWATAEGAVYDMFDGSVGGPHVMVKHRADFKRFSLAMDEGYTNPAVILVIGEDSDGRWHCFREFYRRGVVPEDVVKEAKAWFDEWRCDYAAVDESAAGLIASLQAAGVWAKGGKGRVVDGINLIQDRLKVQGDGKARLTVDPDCSNVINEFESYVWAPDKPKDTPVKENDHALDSIRYMADVNAVPSGAFAGAAGSSAGKSGIEDLGVDVVPIDAFN